MFGLSEEYVNGSPSKSVAGKMNVMFVFSYPVMFVMVTFGAWFSTTVNVSTGSHSPLSPTASVK